MGRWNRRSDVEPLPAMPVFPVTPNTDADAEFDEFTAWLDREVAAGRDPFPAECPESQSVAASFGGDTCGIDPELLAALSGSGGDGGESGACFGQGAAADVLPPSPALAALTEAAVADVSRLPDNQLIGVLQAARRQENREAWKKTLVTAEFARRRAAEFDASAARGIPVHCRPGQFPGEELAAELLLGPIQAAQAIDDATDLATRLPKTLAGMAAGLIDEGRADVIAFYTRSLSRDDDALVDEILAALAPELRLDQLTRKAAALEMKLAPEAVKACREHARRPRQRVEVRQEDSGNASVAGREMDSVDALAAKAHIHALALRLRRAGMPGTLDRLRLLVFSDLTAGRDPLDRLIRSDTSDTSDTLDTSVVSSAQDGEQPADCSEPSASPPDPAMPTSGASGAILDYDDGSEDDDDDAARSAVHARPAVPMPAMIDLVVHAGTLFGWDTSPSEAGG